MTAKPSPSRPRRRRAPRSCRGSSRSPASTGAVDSASALLADVVAAAGPRISVGQRLALARATARAPNTGSRRGRAERRLDDHARRGGRGRGRARAARRTTTSAPTAARSSSPSRCRHSAGQERQQRRRLEQRRCRARWRPPRCRRAPPAPGPARRGTSRRAAPAGRRSRRRAGARSRRPAAGRRASSGRRGSSRTVRSPPSTSV